MSGHIIDTNVNLSRWPFRRLPLDDTSALTDKLAQHGVAQAWAGSFDALLHKDIASVNARLAEECRKRGHGLLIPFGSVNPTLPNWEDDLRRCHEEHKMPGIRLHPNYHDYKLDEPVFAKLLKTADERGLLVQIAVSMEDRRTQHRLATVPDVEIAPLISLLKDFPKLRIVLLNCFRGVKRDLLVVLAGAGKVFFEISTLEGVGGIENLVKQVPLTRVLFGSGAPFFYFESAELKLKESALTDDQTKAILETNAATARLD